MIEESFTLQVHHDGYWIEVMPRLSQDEALDMLKIVRESMPDDAFRVVRVQVLELESDP